MKITKIILLLFLICLSGCKEKVEIPKEKEHQYKHGDNYFSLINEGYGTTVKTQEGGTCWVCAETSAMESNYFLTNKKRIELNPIDLLNKVFLGENDGFYVKGENNRINNGGWPWLSIETVANGLGPYILRSAEVYKETSVDEIKKLIKEKGAVCVETNDGSKKIIDNYATMHDTSDSFDHEVILVGWDDDFPSDYFSPKPKSNGAWLAQNSMSSKWGENGTYWISYETPFLSYTSFSITDKYKEVISYDVGNEASFSLGDSTTVGNYYKNEGKLCAVGLFTANDNEEIIINVYSGKFDKLLATKEIKVNKVGYQLIELDKPLKVNDFSISLTYKGKACVEGESTLYGSIRYTTNINEGESFVFINNEWIDLSSKDIKKIINIDFEPNNCCIKAIFK